MFGSCYILPREDGSEVILQSHAKTPEPIGPNRRLMRFNGPARACADVLALAARECIDNSPDDAFISFCLAVEDHEELTVTFDQILLKQLPIRWPEHARRFEDHISGTQNGTPTSSGAPF